jgi:hypothetical protein
MSVALDKKLSEYPVLPPTVAAVPIDLENVTDPLAGVIVAAANEYPAL